MGPVVGHRISRCAHISALGIRVASPGAASTTKAATGISRKQGAEPRKVSPSVAAGSGAAPSTVQTRGPQGGVGGPASIPGMPKTAKAMGSRPGPMASGETIGTVGRMMDTLSTGIPSPIRTGTIGPRMAMGARSAPRRSPWMQLTPLPSASRSAP